MISIDTEVAWNEALVRKVVDVIPAEAHQAASRETARLVAGKAGRASGRLQGDLSNPKELTPKESQIGSDLVYAGIQNRGGVITPKRSPRLLIHGPGGSGPVVASADAVFIRGSHYMDEVAAYPGLLTTALKARMPKG